MKRIHRYDKFKMLREGRRYEIDFYEAIDFIEKRATEWSIDNKQIFRGISGSENEGVSIIEPSSHERLALASNDNVYNIMIDNLPSWNEYPERHSSVFASFYDRKLTEKEINSWKTEGFIQYNSFGYINFLIPEDGAELAVCETSDLRTSLYAGHNKMNIDNRMSSKKTLSIVNLHKVLNGFNKEFFNDKLDISKWKDIEKMSKSITSEMLRESIDNSKVFEIRFGYVDDIPESMDELGYSNFYEFLNKGFAPENNEMELITYTKSNINNLEGSYYGNKDREVWTESDCLIVNPPLMPRILEELNR